MPRFSQTATYPPPMVSPLRAPRPERLAMADLDSFSLLISSDPQYPWYDAAAMLPPLLWLDSQIAANSERQIRQQYESMNDLVKAQEAIGFPVQAVLVNGDLTSAGHDDQLAKWRALVGQLTIPCYPALGNHDYENYVDDTTNNAAASGMVDFMYGWLQARPDLPHDFRDMGYDNDPRTRRTYSGSMAYSFNVGKVHLVMLQNHPAYQRDWTSFNPARGRVDQYAIRSSMSWLENDLASARNAGDVILVLLHDYNDKFAAIYPQEFQAFRGLMEKYGVSAVFAGHIHADCTLVDRIGTIPVFRSGAASYQDYLVADIDVGALAMTVRRQSSKLVDPVIKGYQFDGAEWPVQLLAGAPASPMPVPPLEGRIVFVDAGGYNALGSVTYEQDGSTIPYTTPTMQRGDLYVCYLPPTATNVVVTGSAQPSGRQVFTQSFSGPVVQFFRFTGTSLRPSYDNEGGQ